MGRISKDRADRLYRTAQEKKKTVTEESKAARNAKQYYTPTTTEKPKQTATVENKPKQTQKNTLTAADNLYMQALAQAGTGDVYIPQTGREAIREQKRAETERFKANQNTYNEYEGALNAAAASGIGQVYTPDFGQGAVKRASEWEQKRKDYEAQQAAAGREYASARNNADYAAANGFDAGSIPYGQTDTARVRYALDEGFRNSLDTFNQRQGLLENPYDNLRYLTDDERRDLSYYASKGDYETANKYLDLLAPDLNARMQGRESAKMRALAQRDPTAGVIANVTAAKEAGLGLIPTIQGAWNETIGNYKPVDTNSRGFRAAHMMQDTSEGVGQAAYEAAGGGIGGDTARFLAETGLSVAQFASLLPMGGAGAVGEAAILGTMGAQAAGSQALDTLQGGGTATQALELAVAAGIIETVTEKIGLENLFRISKTGAKGIKALLNDYKAGKPLVNGIRNFAAQQGSQMGAEAAEEMLSEVGNNLADTIIRGDQSQYNQIVQNLMAQGVSEEQAKAEALFQLYVVNVGMAGLGGALSGGVIGAGGAAVGARYNNELTAVGAELAELGVTPEQLVEAARQNGGADSVAVVNELSQKMARGQEITLADMGRLHLISGRYITSKDFERAEAAAQNAANVEKNVQARNNTENVNGAAVAQQNVSERNATQPNVTQTGAVLGQAVPPEAANVTKAQETPLEQTAPATETTAPATEEATSANEILRPAQNNTEGQNATAEATIEEAQTLPEQTETTVPLAIEKGVTVQTANDGTGTVTAVLGDRVQVRLDNGTIRTYKRGALTPTRTGGILRPTQNDTGRTARVASKATEAQSQTRAETQTAQKQETTYERIARQKWENVQKTAQRKAQSGTVSGTSARMNRAQARAFKKLAKLFNVEIHFLDGIDPDDTINGMYQNGHVFISTTAQNPMAAVLSHEVMHHFEKSAPKAYAKYQKAALTLAERDAPGKVEQYMRDFDLSRTEAEYEVVADFTQTLFDNGENIRTLIRESRSAANGFYNAMRKIFDRIRGENTEAQMRAEYGDEYADMMLEAQRLWRECLRESRENEGRNAAGAEGGEQYSSKTKLYSEANNPYKGKSMIKDKEIYSYDFLTRLPDMNVLEMPPLSAVKTGKNIDQDNVGALGMKNAFALGRKISDTVAGIENNYTQREIRVSKDSLQHGLDGENVGRLRTNARLGAIGGDIIQNALPINALNPENKQAKGTYAMATLLKSGNRLVVAIVTVDQIKNSVSGIEFHDVAHAINGRLKKEDTRSATRAFPLMGTTDIFSTITISDFLKVVNQTHQSILSEDVLNHLKEKRNPEGHYAGKAQFSLKRSPEYTKDLVALHNIYADKLDKALDLGGLPMASIAVTKKDIPHTNFGEISLVFTRATIDPKANRRNTVYSADAWTPTVPQIEYEADKKKAAALRRKFYDLEKKYGRDNVEALYQWGNYAEDELNRVGGAKGAIERYRDDDRMMRAFLADTQGKVIEPVVKETRTRLKDEDIKLYDHLINALGKEAVNEIKAPEGENPRQHRVEWLQKHGDKLKAAYTAYLTELGLTAEEADNVIANEKPFSMALKVNAARKYLENGAETVTTETDYEATRERIREATDQKAYEAWLNDLFDGLEKQSGIYNNKEYYTPSGNRRSFSDTHYPVTLDNIVKAMLGQNGGNTKNVSGFHGVKTLRAGMATRFKSVDHMHELEGRLKNLTEEEAEQINEALGERLTEVIRDIYNTRADKSSTDNYFIIMDEIGETLEEIAESGKYSLTDIRKAFEKYRYPITTEIAQDVKALLFDISEMPVNIFEAKPERVVGFDEVLAAVVPSDIDPALRKRIEDAGMRTIEYEAGNTESRVKAVNSVEGAQFSRKRTTQTEITARYQQTVDDILSGKKNITDAVLMGYTPDIYQKLGVPSLPFVIGPGHIYSIAKTEAEAKADGKYNKRTHYHGLGDDAVKNLYEAAQKPVAIIAAKDVDAKATPLRSTHSVVAIIDVGTAGKSRLAPIEITAERTLNGDILDVNVVSSAYDRNVDGLLTEAIAQENTGEVGVYYIKKEAAPLVSARVQFPEHLHKATASDGIVHLIPEKVNMRIENQTQSQQFKRWFGDWQNDPEHASKIVNEDGTPKVVYHGTLHGGFNVFGGRHDFWYFADSKDYARIFAGLDENGEYASGVKDSIEKGDLTSQIYEAYLNVRNPFVTEDEDIIEDALYWDSSLAEKLRKKGYDALMLKDMSQIIVLNPNQIKSATDNVGTFDSANDDIRYSRKGQSDVMRRLTLLARENARLREQMKQTQGLKLNEYDIRRAIRGIIKDYDITELGADELFTPFETLAKQMMKAGQKGDAAENWANIHRSARTMAEVIGSRALRPSEDAEYMRDVYDGVRDALKGVRVLNPFQGDNVKAERNYYRQKLMGTLTLTSDRSTDTDLAKVYGQLTEQFGEGFFPSSITHEEEMIEHIADVIDDLKAAASMTVGEDIARNAKDAEEYADSEYGGFYEEIAQDVIKRLMDVRRAAPTKADKIVAKQKEIRRAAVQRAVERERKKRDEKIAKLKDKYKGKTAEIREKQKAKELRRKIERHTKELYQKYDKPTDKKHVPEDLRSAVKLLLRAINNESTFERDPATGKHLPKGTSEDFMTARTRAAAAVQEQLEKDEAGELTFDAELIEYLKALYRMNDTPILSMNSEQLQVVWDAVRGVESMISSANKAFGEMRAMTIEQLASALVEGVDLNNPKQAYNATGFGKAAGLTDKLLHIDNLSPQAYFHRFGAGGDALFKMLRNAQDKYTRIVADMQARTAPVVAGIDIGKLNEDTATYKVTGGDITLSRASVLALYAYAKREQALGHIFGGGLRAKPQKGKGLRAVTQLLPVETTAEDLQKIFDEAKLTDEEKRAADGLVRLMSTTLADYGNAASMAVYGYKKFLEDWYIPIETDPTTHQNSDESPLKKAFMATTSPANKGFTKQTQKGAKNALMVGSIFDLYAKHVNEMAMYAAYLEALENLRRVRNYQFDNGKRVANYIEALLGKDGVAYWDTLVRDINGGERLSNNDSFFDSFIGAYKAAAVSANVRVILQQPTAILRAMAEINPRFLVSALGRQFQRGEWERIKKNAPIAQWKDWGYFDINTGRQMQDVILGTDSAFEKLKQAGMRPMSGADSLSWTLLYHACEDEAKARGFKRGTPEFDAIVADRFADIINKTQVVDGVLQRSQIMRNTNAITRMATSFMAEPTKTYNMLLSAAWDLRRAKSDEAKTAAKKKVAYTAMALVTSFAVNAIMQSIVDAMRDDDRDKKYLDRLLDALLGRSDEDEKPKQKFINTISGNLFENMNPVEWVPFIKDILSLVKGFDSKRMDTETISRFISAAQSALNAANGEGKQTVFAATLALMSELSRGFGIPLATIKRDTLGILNTIATETDNYGLMYAIDKPFYKLDKNKPRYVSLMIKADEAGDHDTARKIQEDLLAAGFSEDDIRKAANEAKKKLEGVTHIDELSSRYMFPDEQKKYDQYYNAVKNHDTYKKAGAAQREEYEDNLYALVIGSDSAIQKQEKARAIGITDNQYLEALMALHTVDQPKGTKGHGSYSNDETDIAVERVRVAAGLTQTQSYNLWDALSSSTSNKNNPYK